MTPRAARAALFAAFASLGVTASFIPAILPAAGRALGSDLSVAIPVLFAGLLAGVLTSGPLLARWSVRSVLLIGSALQVAAIIATAVAGNLAVFVTAAAVAGIGFGLVEASGSVAAKAASAGSSTGLLSALTGTLAVCAAATPLLVAGASSVLPALALLALIPLGTIAVLARTAAAPAPARAPVSAAARTLVPLLPFAIALPVYVGVETVLSGWSAVIPARALPIDPGMAALGTSMFWTLMAVGRFSAAALHRARVTPLTILAVGSISATVLLGTAGLLRSSAPAWALAAIAISVVALAPSYGLILGLALDRLEGAQSRAVTGALVACGAVGGTLVPSAILVVGRDPASVTTFLVSAALCALIPILLAVAHRAGPRRTDRVRLSGGSAPRHR